MFKARLVSTCLILSLVMGVPELVAESSDVSVLHRASAGDSDLDTFLAEALPPWVLVTEIRTKEFPGDGGGRMSVAGTATTLQNLVVPSTNHIGLWQRLSNDDVYGSPGLIDGAIYLAIEDTAAQTNAVVKEYHIATPAGSAIEFRAELPYLETVDGRSYSGAVDYTLPNSDARQVAAADISAGSYVVDGLRFDEVLRSAGMHQSTLYFHLDAYGLRPIYYWMLMPPLPFIATHYDQPTIEFSFLSELATEDLFARARFAPPVADVFNAFPARLEIDFPLDASTFPGSNASYAQLAERPDTSWWMTLIMPVQKLPPEQAIAQIRYRSPSVVKANLTQPMLWNGQFFEIHHWKFYPYE